MLPTDRRMVKDAKCCIANTIPNDYKRPSFIVHLPYKNYLTFHNAHHRLCLYPLLHLTLPLLTAMVRNSVWLNDYICIRSMDALQNILKFMNAATRHEEDKYVDTVELALDESQAAKISPEILDAFPEWLQRYDIHPKRIIIDGLAEAQVNEQLWAGVRETWKERSLANLTLANCTFASYADFMFLITCFPATGTLRLVNVDFPPRQDDADGPTYGYWVDTIRIGAGCDQGKLQEWIWSENLHDVVQTIAVDSGSPDKETGKFYVIHDDLGADVQYLQLAPLVP
ncbi:hypothetical protein K474DRAFT_1029291 [Panus rudis PR-1116 ss-1]|nr:hypothetical protein K474DRAFT_1029291 [Panus rudis PR-1116 ss-1]